MLSSLEYSGSVTDCTDCKSSHALALFRSKIIQEKGTQWQYQGFQENRLPGKYLERVEGNLKITFIHNTGEYDGIDNVFASNLNIMYNLIRHFHFNLDDISSKYNYLMFHENMVYYESEILCGNTINIDPFVYYGRLLSNQIINHFAGI